MKSFVFLTVVFATLEPVTIKMAVHDLNLELQHWITKIHIARACAEIHKSGAVCFESLSLLDVGENLILRVSCAQKRLMLALL